MTREELLARIDEHEALAAGWKTFIEQQLDHLEDGGWVAEDRPLNKPGKRHDQRGLRESLCNEAEVRVDRIAEACQLSRQEIQNGDGDKAMFFEHQAKQERDIVEPMIADLRNRAARSIDGAKGGANSWKAHRT